MCQAYPQANVQSKPQKRRLDRKSLKLLSCRIRYRLGMQALHVLTNTRESVEYHICLFQAWQCKTLPAFAKTPPTAKCYADNDKAFPKSRWSRLACWMMRSPGINTLLLSGEVRLAKLPLDEHSSRRMPLEPHGVCAFSADSRKTQMHDSVASPGIATTVE